MQWLVDVLKSRGKVGGGASVLLGMYILIEYFLSSGDKNPEIMTVGLLAITNGFALFGIRMKQDTDTPPST